MKTAITIGFFDGVHLGHQALLNVLRKYPHTTIFTFSNHPLSLFAPPGPDLLLPLEEKLALLKTFADELIVVPFTKAFAATPFDQFLDQFDLAHLVLGQGAAFGKDREGTENHVRQYALSRNMTVEYIPKLQIDGRFVSTTAIRQAKASGNHSLVTQLLGRS